MPEYLAPGVYVEEVSSRAKSIKGVSTSTCAFVGTTRKGPLGSAPALITSVNAFEQIFGGLGALSFSPGTDAAPNATNFLAHAVRAFFDNGGQRLYVARCFEPRIDPLSKVVSNGLAQATVFANGGNKVEFVARMPGAALNGSIKLSLLRTPSTAASLTTVVEGSLLQAGGLYYEKRGSHWISCADGISSLDVNGAGNAELLSLNLQAKDADGAVTTYDALGFAATHPSWIGKVLAMQPARPADAQHNAFVLRITGSFSTLDLHKALFGNRTESHFALRGGHDGAEPDTAAYNAALALLEPITDVSIIAAPGHSALTLTSFEAVQRALIAHAEKMRDRVALLDTPAAQSINDARAIRAKIDSTYAALYYPWVVVTHPLARLGKQNIPAEITLPPSGFICGLYARNDLERAVWKAPANLAVNSALRFEIALSQAQQELLNPEGVNCLRSFPGHGHLVWGARTTSSNPEWKYINIRRYCIYLEQSISRGTTWAVFEPNTEALWANIRQAVEAFLYQQWRDGAILGTTPNKAYFVRCDRSTMTQDDLDNGRLICLIGVAPLKPAEFVIFRIGQKTADA